MKSEGVLCGMFSDVKQIKPSFALASLSGGFANLREGLFKMLFSSSIRIFARHFPEIQRTIFTNAANRIMKHYNFDTVVACKENKPTLFASFFSSHNKVAWVRCDYNRYANHLNFKRQEYEVYKRFNSIVCVSERTSADFSTVFPEFKQKTYTINNPQSEQYILNQSAYNDFDSRFVRDGVTLLSIGRIDPVKRFSCIPKFAADLLQKGINFKWYIVGDGNHAEYDKIAQEIDKYSMSEYVVCLGVKTNPHFYIAHSDLLICLSSSEACPRVINEAKILHTPVVCTDFPTAKEFINSGCDGLICSIDAIPDNIYRLLTDISLKNKIYVNMNSFRFDNTPLLMQLDKIL